jgi:hypothetical protein
VDCEREGKGGIRGMIHEEYGVGYNVVDGTLAPLADDTRRLTESPPWTLGIVEAVDETNDISLPIDMTFDMRSNKITISNIEFL